MLWVCNYLDCSFSQVYPNTADSPSIIAYFLTLSECLLHSKITICLSKLLSEFAMRMTLHTTSDFEKWSRNNVWSFLCRSWLSSHLPAKQTTLFMSSCVNEFLSYLLIPIIRVIKVDRPFNPYRTLNDCCAKSLSAPSWETKNKIENKRYIGICLFLSANEQLLCMFSCVNESIPSLLLFKQRD